MTNSRQRKYKKKTFNKKYLAHRQWQIQDIENMKKKTLKQKTKKYFAHMQWQIQDIENIKKF